MHRTFISYEYRICMIFHHYLQYFYAGTDSYMQPISPVIPNHLVVSAYVCSSIVTLTMFCHYYLAAILERLTCIPTVTFCLTLSASLASFKLQYYLATHVPSSSCELAARQIG